MRISKYFELGVNQESLNFVDVDTDRDVRLFIDPCWIHISEGHWFNEASATLFSFFNHIITLYEEGRVSEARELFNCAHEPNETCFGLSRNDPQGTGASVEMLAEVFDYIVNHHMIENGLIQRVEDLHVFIENFGPDRLSDLVTNIIRKHLADFTRSQCELYEIPLGDTVINIGPYWNRETNQWEDCIDFPLVVDERNILLVPKIIAVSRYKYTAGQYCTHYVLVKRQTEHLEQNTRLVTREPRKNNGYELKVYKKDIIEEEMKNVGKSEKQYVKEMTENHRDLIVDFRNGIDGILRDPERTNKLSDEELMLIVGELELEH
ncbi:hypothetical protein P4T74_31245 [Bacillus mycoides]|uniref:hypothetical protein n=1 Tax=Bacillus mycoides TaxID=1405 RepID=UPI002E245C03|nr:hypothetical protein [Bacillus mycoides]